MILMEDYVSVNADLAEKVMLGYVPTPEEAEGAFIRHAQAVADQINSRSIETTAGFAACHGHKPKTQYNKDENNE